MKFQLSDFKKQLIVTASLFFMLAAVVFSRKNNPQQLPEGCEAFEITQGDLASATVILFGEKIFQETLSAVCAYVLMKAIEGFQQPSLYLGVAGNVSTDHALAHWTAPASLAGINYGRELLPGYHALVDFDYDGNALPLPAGHRYTFTWEDTDDWYRFRKIIDNALRNEMIAHVNRLGDDKEIPHQRMVELLEGVSGGGLILGKFGINEYLAQLGYPEVTVDEAFAESRKIAGEMLGRYNLAHYFYARRDDFNLLIKDFFKNYFKEYFDQARDTTPDYHAPTLYVAAAEECQRVHNMDLAACRLKTRGQEFFDKRVGHLKSALAVEVSSRCPSRPSFFFAEKTILNRAVSQFIEENNNESVEGLVVLEQRV